MTKVPLIDSTDATRWADEVMKVDWAEHARDDAWEILFGWFANAIAAGEKAAARKFREENPDSVARCECCGQERPGSLDTEEGIHLCWRCQATLPPVDEEREARYREALEAAEIELKRNAATWIALEPILSAHVYKYEPRGDGNVWNAYKRWARAEQALAVAEKARAALAEVSHGE